MGSLPTFRWPCAGTVMTTLLIVTWENAEHIPTGMHVHTCTYLCIHLDKKLNKTQLNQDQPAIIGFEIITA